MTGTPHLLVAAGGLGRESAAALSAAGVRAVAFVDEDPATHGRSVAGVPVLGGLEHAGRLASAPITVTAGKGTARELLVERLRSVHSPGAALTSIVHPAASIGARCRIGVGSVVLAGAVLTCDVTVGEHVVVMPNAVLTHDVVVEDYVTICAGVSVGGSALLRRASYIGMNASIREGTTIGARAVIGMGAAVVSDQPDGETWVGVPARPRVSV